MKPLSSQTLIIAIEAIKDDIKRSEKLLTGSLSAYKRDIHERSIKKQLVAIEELRGQ
jgi:hypothetical protein